MDEIEAAGLEAVEVLEEQAFIDEHFTLSSIAPLLEPFLADGTGGEDRFLISVNGEHSGAGTGYGKPFVIRVKTSYEDFVETHFTEAEQADALISGELGDPDGDGLNNLLEHVFGTAPRESNGGVVAIGPSPDSFLRFPWNPEANFSYRLQWGKNLESFKDVPFEESSRKVGSLLEVTLIPDLSLEDTGPSAFFRIRVESR